MEEYLVIILGSPDYNRLKERFYSQREQILFFKSRTPSTHTTQPPNEKSGKYFHVRVIFLD